MDPQLNSQPDKIDDAVMTITTVEEPTQPTQPMQPAVFAPVHSRSNKKFIFIGVAALLLIVAAVVGYVVITQMSPSSKKADNHQSTSQTTPSTPLDAATNELTKSASSEMSLIDTDDSSDIGDASTAASNVGDSVNENNL